MKKHLILPIASLTAVMLAFTACDRSEEEILTEPDPTSAKTSAEATKTFDDVAMMTEEATVEYMDNPDYDTYTFGPCVTVLHDSINTILTFDLGTTGCVGLDGQMRKGKIIVDYNGVPREPGCTLSITLEDFSVDGYSLSGTLTYQAVDYNTSGDLEIAYAVDNGIYTEPDGDVVTFECERTVTWTEGAGSEDLYDDVFTTNGAFTATLNGDAYSGATVNDIVFKSACWADGIYYPVSGTWQLNFPDGINRVIDYGNGDCDKTVVITVGLRDYTYQLP